jgi:hypothetical protein
MADIENATTSRGFRNDQAGGAIVSEDKRPLAAGQFLLDCSTGSGNCEVVTFTLASMSTLPDREEARRCRTDWSSLLRQRIRVLAWVRAGRPLSKWRADMASEDGT